MEGRDGLLLIADGEETMDPSTMNPEDLFRLILRLRSWASREKLDRT
jgi:hypothetical protein